MYGLHEQHAYLMGEYNKLPKKKVVEGLCFYNGNEFVEVCSTQKIATCFLAINVSFSVVRKKRVCHQLCVSVHTQSTTQTGGDRLTLLCGSTTFSHYALSFCFAVSQYVKGMTRHFRGASEGNQSGRGALEGQRETVRGSAAPRRGVRGESEVTRDVGGALERTRQFGGA